MGLLQLRPRLPKLGEQHHVEHFAQIADARGATGADLVADRALDGGDMVEAPAAGVVPCVDELFHEVIV